MGKSLVTAATEYPISLSEAKRQARITDDPGNNEEDLLIESYVAAATRYLEEITGRQLVDATWDYTIDRFPSGAIVLPLSPVSSITQVSYIDSDGASQVLATSVYRGITDVEPGRVECKWGQTWPATRSETNAVTVRFVAGYGARADVPEDFKQALRLLVGHMIENREAVLTDPTLKTLELPLGFKALVYPRRVRL